MIYKTRWGFTGTQAGMTTAQQLTVRNLLNQNPNIHIADHGDCIGADEDFDKICISHGIYRVIHPPIISLKRAFCKGDKILPPAPYLVRNHDIVDATVALIACPKEYQEQLRSGTWATVRYARKRGKKIYLILPDGRIE